MKDLTEKHKSCCTHCCVLHGCKYGHKDCPVVLGVVKQKYLCESCDDGFFIDVDAIEKKIYSKFLKLNRKLKLYELKG